MPMNVPPAAGEGIVAEAARDAARQPVQRASDAALSLEHPTVAQHQPHQRHQIGRRPVAIHEGLADADVAAGERPQEEPLVVDRQGRVQLASRPRTGTCGRGTPRSAFRRVRPPRPERNAVFAHCVTMLIAPSPNRSEPAVSAAYAARSPTPSRVRRRTTRHTLPPQLQRLPVDARHDVRGHRRMADERAPDLARAPGPSFERQRRVEADRRPP